MALDARVQRLINCNNSSFYDAMGRDDELSPSQMGFPKLTKKNNNHYLKLHHLNHMIQGRSGKVLSDSNDGSSLISFEDSTDQAAARGHGYVNDSNMGSSEGFNNSHQSATSFDSQLLVGENRSHLKGKVNNRDDMLDWYYSSDATHDHHQATIVHKNNRPNMDENYMPPSKKQCTTTTKKSKQAKPAAAVSKDPQSIAAKNRRERISERLKILQELVPNGTKVDLVTMLEKAIGYVKFLQLQVKVLAADEFWPVQGGKAPQLSQVKDAIDAILSSQRSDRNSASN